MHTTSARSLLLRLGGIKLILEILYGTRKASLFIVDLEAEPDGLGVVERARPGLDDGEYLWVGLVGYELESFWAADLFAKRKQMSFGLKRPKRTHRASMIARGLTQIPGTFTLRVHLPGNLDWSIVRP